MMCRHAHLMCIPQTSLLEPMAPASTRAHLLSAGDSPLISASRSSLGVQDRRYRGLEVWCLAKTSRAPYQPCAAAEATKWSACRPGASRQQQLRGHNDQASAAGASSGLRWLTPADGLAGPGPAAGAPACGPGPAALAGLASTLATLASSLSAPAGPAAALAAFCCASSASSSSGSFSVPNKASKSTV